MTMSDDELAQHRACLEGGIAAYNVVDRMTDELPEVKWPRTPGRRPTAAENPHNVTKVHEVPLERLLHDPEETAKQLRVDELTALCKFMTGAVETKTPYDLIIFALPDSLTLVR